MPDTKPHALRKRLRAAAAAYALLGEKELPGLLREAAAALLAAQPAPGIDLGRVATLVLHARVYLQDGLNSQCMNKLDDLQILIGQRDATGVDRG